MISNCSVRAKRLISIEITCIQPEQFCSLTAGVSGKININDFTQRISSQGLQISLWCVFSNSFSKTTSLKTEQNVPELENTQFHL